MTEPSRTHHERVVDHLKAATKHLDEHRKKVEASLESHLAKNPVVPITPPTESES